MKYFIALSLFLVSLLPASAKVARDVFIEDSIKVFNSIEKNTRLDMIDYYEYGQAGEGTNQFGAKIAIDTLTRQYFSMELSKVSHVEYWVSDTLSNKAIIVFNQTYKAPTADGKLEFYSTEWRKLKPSKVIKLPTISDFIVIPNGDKKKVKEIEEMIDMQFISYSINPENGNITARQNLEEFLSKQEYKPLKDYLVKEIEYEWTGKKYNRIK